MNVLLDGTMPFKWLFVFIKAYRHMSKASVLLHRHSLKSVYGRPAINITYTACLNTMTTTRTGNILLDKEECKVEKQPPMITWKEIEMHAWIKNDKRTVCSF